jgi:hypothetical protein
MLLSAPRVDFLYKQHPPITMQMEILNKRSNESISNSTKALLKAQLLAGQHTLNKERFVNISKQHGWILQIPEHLLV